MNTAQLKAQLDAHFAQLHEPPGVVPQWHSPAASADDIAAARARLGALPDEVAQLFAAFGGLEHNDTPYQLGERFAALAQAVQAQATEPCDDVQEAGLADDLMLNDIYPLSQWGEDPDGLRDIHREQLDALADGGKAICIGGLSAKQLDDERLVLIGSSSSGALFIDLDPSRPSYGAIFNTRDFYPDLVVHRIADNYLHLWQTLLQSQPD